MPPDFADLKTARLTSHDRAHPCLFHARGLIGGADVKLLTALTLGLLPIGSYQLVTAASPSAIPEFIRIWGWLLGGGTDPEAAPRVR
jgi:hypothetical protein